MIVLSTVLAISATLDDSPNRRLSVSNPLSGPMCRSGLQSSPIRLGPLGGFAVAAADRAVAVELGFD
jgi:hypothetical protein